MKRVKFLSGFLVLMAVTAPGIAQAFSATVEKSQTKILNASFFGGGECAPGIPFISDANIEWADRTETRSAVPGGITNQHFANIVLNVEYLDLCTNDHVVMIAVIDPSGINVSMASDLSSGHLQGTIHVATDPDAEGTPNQADLAVNLNWVATGPAVTQTNKGSSVEGGVVTTSTYSTTTRPGRATGSITGTLHLDSGASPTVNFVQGQSQEASLVKQSSEVDTVTR